MPDTAHRPGPDCAPSEAETRARMLEGLRAPLGPVGPAGPGRAIAARAPLGRLSGLLDEIDATVMARSLLLQDQRGARIRLEVCNRRLLNVAIAGAAPRPLTYADGGALDALRRDLADVLADPGVRLGWAPPSGDATPDQSGVSVATLRQAWEAPPPPERPAAPAQSGPERVRHLCDAVANALVAGLRVEASGATALAGPATTLAALDALAEGLGQAGLIRADGPADLTILAQGGAQAVLVVASSGGATALLLLPPTAQTAVIAHWESRH